MVTTKPFGSRIIGRVIVVIMRVLLLACLLSLAACAQQSSLYSRLGEQTGISTIVDNLLFNIAEDKKIIHHFEQVDIDRFREKLIEHLCELSEGPCRYDGDSMKVVHAGMGISAAEFDSLVDDLMDAMEEAGIDYRSQIELIALLVPFRTDILGDDQ